MMRMCLSQMVHAYESDLDSWFLWWKDVLDIEQVSYVLDIMNFLILWSYLEILIYDILVYLMFG